MVNTPKSGSPVFGHTEVTDIEVIDGRVRAVVTPMGRFEADVVVSCAGIWGPKIGRMVGVPMALVPMERMCTPEEIGRLATYLAGDDASYITGTTVTIDGGATLIPRV